jgi:hypothetical protein
MGLLKPDYKKQTMNLNVITLIGFNKARFFLLLILFSVDFLFSVLNEITNQK